MHYRRIKMRNELLEHLKSFIRVQEERMPMKLRDEGIANLFRERFPFVCILKLDLKENSRNQWIYLTNYISVSIGCFIWEIYFTTLWYWTSRRRIFIKTSFWVSSSLKLSLILSLDRKRSSTIGRKVGSTKRGKYEVADKIFIERRSHHVVARLSQSPSNHQQVAWCGEQK